jgi:hypothetical protein
MSTIALLTNNFYPFLPCHRAIKNVQHLKLWGLKGKEEDMKISRLCPFNTPKFLQDEDNPFTEITNPAVLHSTADGLQMAKKYFWTHEDRREKKTGNHFCVIIFSVRRH